MPERHREPTPDGDARPETPDSSDGIGGTETRKGCCCAASHERQDSLGSAFAGVVRRLADQWFGPAAHGWSFPKRFLCAGVGSATFFLALFLGRITPDYSRLLTDPLYLLSNLPVYFVVITFSAWFAWLVSWKDMQYGPIRLYLYGFLLPYFIARLVDGWLLVVER